tara:strand:+ start:160 stop:333 length:174 start_codon:yes stop_codon:yes gene_type:complete
MFKIATIDQIANGIIDRAILGETFTRTQIVEKITFNCYAQHVAEKVADAVMLELAKI